MSGRNWLDRDPKDSPGLKSIEKLHQAVNAEKEHLAMLELEREKKIDEFRKQILMQREIVESEASRLFPLMKEVADFANKTHSYPLPSIGDSYTLPSIGELNLGLLGLHKDPTLELAKPAEVNVAKCLNVELENHRFMRIDGEFFAKEDEAKKLIPEYKKAYDTFKSCFASEHLKVDVDPKPEIIITVSYGYKGDIYKEDQAGWGDNARDSSHRVDASFNYGVSIRVDNQGQASILRQRLVHVPEKKWPKSNAVIHAHNETINIWSELPDDLENKRKVIAEAFHDPVYLGAEELYYHHEITPQPEPQTSTGIAGLVKGFLGLK